MNNLEAKLLYVLNTHVTLPPEVVNKKAPKRQLCVISKSSEAAADIHVNHGDKIKFGEQTLTVKSTPGHTPGCVTYILND